MGMNNIEKVFSYQPEKFQEEFARAKEAFDKHGIKNTIAVFGSARAKPEDKLSKKYYEATYELSKRLALWSKEKYKDNKEEKLYICTGGGGGIMGAANRGAHDAGEINLGCTILLPKESKPNPYITEGLSIPFDYFFIRKFWLINLAEAFVIFPGGFGTFDELFEILTLAQTHKMHKTVPFVLFGKKFFEKFLNIKLLEEHGYISDKDKNLFILTDSIDEAFNHITSAFE